MLVSDGIPWLPTDVIRTVVRRVVPEVDAADQDPVDADPRVLPRAWLLLGSGPGWLPGAEAAVRT
jgi:hypothetical protein